MLRGIAEQFSVEGARGLADLIAHNLGSAQALAFGVTMDSRALVLSSGRAQKWPGAIARTREFFAWPDGHGVMLLDYDPALGQPPMSLQDLLSVIALPDKTPFVAIPSVGGCIWRGDEELIGIRGWHVFVIVAHAADIPRAGAALFQRLWLKGYGRIEISQSGSMNLRAPIDRVVWQPERLSFDGGAACSDGLEQRRIEHMRLFNADMPPLDTRASMHDLDIVEQGEYAALLATAKDAVRDTAKAVQAAHKEALERKKVEQKACYVASPRSKTEKTAEEVRIDTASPLLHLVINRMPKKPYCSNDFEKEGVKIREKKTALQHREIQLNLPWLRQCTVYDLDHERTLSRDIPVPNITVTNPVNGHRHAAIVWQSPILVGPESSRKARQLYQDTAAAVRRIWEADPNYQGTLCHNFLHPDWQVEIHHQAPYELSDFRDALKIVRRMPANHPRANPGQWAQGYAELGRNCKTWECCRWPAYALGKGATLEVVLALVEDYNATNNQPSLSLRECLSIAKSISGYVQSGKRRGLGLLPVEAWQVWVDHTHRSEIQARRGAKGGKASGAARRASREEKVSAARLLRGQGMSIRMIAVQQEVDAPWQTVARWCAKK